jgi:hypothetical protein
MGWSAPSSGPNLGRLTMEGRMIRNKPRGATVYGVDLGKNVFHVVGTDARGNVVQRANFRAEPCLRSLSVPSGRW